MNNIIDFCKKLTSNMKNKNITINQPIKTNPYILLENPQEIDNHNTITIIKQNLSQKILDRLTTYQKKAYELEEKRNNECIICFESNIDFVSLQCMHSICNNCYQNLIKNKYFNCPYCNMQMKLYSKYYAIITPCGPDIGILYLPPIFVKNENLWKDCERLALSEMDSLVESCHIIDNEKYILVVADPSLVNIISGVHKKIPNLYVSILRRSKKNNIS